MITPITHFALLRVRHRLSLLLHDRPNLLSCACVIGCFECCLSEIAEVLEGGNADKPNLLSCACVIGCFERVCAVWVLAMGKVLFRSVTCLIRMQALCQISSPEKYALGCVGCPLSRRSCERYARQRKIKQIFCVRNRA